MPYYVYKCQKCGLEVEATKSVAERDTFSQQCECGGDLFKRQITPGNFKLKGSGWAADGYGKGTAAAPEESETR